MARWFRSHASKLNNPKVQRLSDKLYRAWDSLLCVASEFDGVMPPLADVAFLLRKSEREAKALMDDLIERGFLVVTKRGVEPHQWNEWQYKSDVSTNRVKQFRERRRNVSVTPSESETEAETDTESKKDHSTAAKPGANKRGTRLTDDWQLTDELRSFASDLGLDPGNSRDEFVDFWTSVPGSKGLKLDWGKTFKNRCRELASRPKNVPRPAMKTFDQMRRDAAATVAEEPWDQRMRGWHMKRFWHNDYGPEPGQPGCRVPSKFLVAA